MLKNIREDSRGSIPPLCMPSLLPHDLCHEWNVSRRLPASPRFLFLKTARCIITYPSSHGDIVDAVFSNVLITATEPGNVSANGVTFQGMFAPVHIPSYDPANTQDYLFLGANNELYWPSDDDSFMRGFRAYFIIDRNTITPAQAPKGSHARIVEREDNTTEIESIQSSAVSIQKVLRDGQLIIIRNGVEYNAKGQMIK